MANHSTTSVADLLQMVAANLKSHMQACDMSMQALADASGVSKRTVGNFLNPRKPKSEGKEDASGTMANFFRLAAALKVEPWELLCKPERARLFTSIERTYLNEFEHSLKSDHQDR